MVIENENFFRNTIKKVKENKEYKSIIKQFRLKILSNITMINDCIIYNPDNLKEEDINWNYVLETEKDFTGFEANMNDIRIGDYFNINNAELIELTYIIVDELSIYLKKKYTNCIFEIVSQMDINSNDIFIRFYQKRKDEMWIDICNLDNYNNENLLIKIC